MHDALVKMKDGRVFCGAVWSFNTKEGYFSIVSDEEGVPDKIMFDDVESAIQSENRTSVNTIEDVDLLELARERGWKPI